MNGAKGILFNITGGANVGIHEINEATRIITEAADENAFIIWGHVFDPEMDDSIQITVIATGFDNQVKKEAHSDPGFSRKVDISAVKHLNAFSSTRNIPQPHAQQSADQAEKRSALKSFSVPVTKESVTEKPAEPKDESLSSDSKKSIAEDNKQPQPPLSAQEQDTPTVIRATRTTPAQPPQDEDMFKGSGAPLDQFDVPAYLRRRRES